MHVPNSKQSDYFFQNLKLIRLFLAKVITKAGLRLYITVRYHLGADIHFSLIHSSVSSH